MISLGPGKMNIDIFNKFVMGHAILTKVIGLVNKTLNMTFFKKKNVFKIYVRFWINDVLKTGHFQRKTVIGLMP